MAVDFDKGMRPNLYELMQEGPGGELQPATTETLGGVIIGRGINVEEDGTISVTSPAPADTYTKEEIDAQQEAQDYNINSNALAIERLEDAIDDTYSKADIDSQQQAQDTSISANATDITTIKGDIDSIKAEQITQNTNISVNAQTILAHTNQINSLADYNVTQDDAIAANTTAIAANTTAIANNATAIQNEATARESMDSTLAANIASNVAAIAAEVAARESGDSELQNALDVLSQALTTLSETIASDSQLGLIKTDSSRFIETDSDGKLIIGGRLGQWPTTTGLFAPDNREPRFVGNYNLMITDAMGMYMSNSRSLAVITGLGVTCKSAPAGTTEYHVVNNYANRIMCKIAEEGYAAQSEAASNANLIIPVLSVTINGQPFTPDSSPNNSSNDIIITTEETLNPDSAITNIRLFGKMNAYSTAHIGNGIKSVDGGRNMLLGAGITKAGSTNENCFVGNSIFGDRNGSAAFGRYHIIRKNRVFAAGAGHDFTNAKGEGAAAVGLYSDITSSTFFAVGNGTSHTARSNCFEVLNDGIVLKSPNNTRFKISVDDSGNLVTTQL